MKRIARVIATAGICAALLCGCTSNTVREKDPMPFTKNAIVQYMQKSNAVVKATNPAEVLASKGNPEKQKELMYKCYIQPMEACGYNYDKTITNLCKALLAKRVNFPDMETTIMFSDLLTFAKDTRDFEFKSGFISQETKDLLDKASVILPR